MSKAYVYAIAAWPDKDGDRPAMVKIGITSDGLSSRLKTIRTSCPYHVEIYTAIELESLEHARICERLLHSKYRDKRLNGEWFTFDTEMDDFLNNGMGYLGTLMIETLSGFYSVNDLVKEGQGLKK